jgi:glycosyltransferase involved in cell wall biosynthesis
MNKPKLIRITTIPESLRGLLKGQLRFMSDHYHVIGVCSPGEAANEVIANEGVPMVYIPMTRTISPIADLKSLWAMYRFFKKEKPLIVHSHTPKAGTIGMIAAKLAGVPVRLHTVAGLPLVEVTGFKRKILDVVEKITYRCATKVYPNSFGLRDIILQNNYANSNKVKVIGNGSSNGINLEFFTPEHYDAKFKSDFLKSVGVAEHDFVYLFVGRIVKDKGINELVAAFKKVNSKFENTKLILVGRYENELNPISNETALEIKNNTSIIEVGFQKEVRPYFYSSDVLVFPSYREGFPNVVLQAGAMGLNAIVSDINGCNEIVQDGETGFIVPRKNSELLQLAMEKVYVNHNQNQEMGRKAKELIQNKYNQKVVWNKILEEYQSYK